MDKRKIVIYVAGKYAGKNSDEVEENVNLALATAKKIWELGFTVICPHGNNHFSHFCSQHGNKVGLEYIDFLTGDMELINRSDGIFLLSNWKDSPGACKEWQFAEENSIPIFYWLEELSQYEWKEQYIEFRKVVDKMYHLHVQKNKDYSSINILGAGIKGVVIRLWDKVCRLMNLVGFKVEVTFLDKGRIKAIFSPGNEKKAGNEPEEDSWLDAAVYSIIGLLVRREKWGK